MRGKKTHCSQKKSSAGAGRRCRSWRRASWPAQGPGDPGGAARASRPRPVSGESAAGSTAGRPCPSASQRHRPSYTVSPAGQRLKRSRPAVGAAQAVGRHKKAPPGNGDSSGARVGQKRELAQDGPPTSFNPSDHSRKRILHKKMPQREAGASFTGYVDGRAVRSYCDQAPSRR